MMAIANPDASSGNGSHFDRKVTDWPGSMVKRGRATFNAALLTLILTANLLEPVFVSLFVVFTVVPGVPVKMIWKREQYTYRY